MLPYLMNTMRHSALFALGLALALHALAADSALRVTCQADAAGAEVHVNGKFKGECPLDIAVQEGEYKLRVVKAVDASHERSFEQTVRIGDGVAKKIEITLSPPQLNALGQQRAAEVGRQEQAALQPLRQSAESGNVPAMLAIARAYSTGRGFTQSYEQAVYWLRKAAETGNTQGMVSLGWYYATGRGFAKNDELATAWYRQAAEAGDTDGMVNLGNQFAQGLGIAQSDDEAISWYRKAAQAGSAYGMWSLGNQYQNGRGVARSDELATAWYLKAAQGGNPFGMMAIGRQYANARGIAKNDEQAVFWYRKAAENGLAVAVTELQRRGLQ